MSSGERMDYRYAKILADRLVAILADECERVAIAGSLRRRSPTVGDLEIVCIPKSEQADLLGNAEFGHGRVERVLREYGFQIIKNGQFFKQAIYPGAQCTVDIFLATPEKWGCVFTIRTGSAWFSHKLVTKKREGGLCPSNIDFQDGRLWRNGELLNTPEEQDVFKELGLEWIEPEDRK